MKRKVIIFISVCILLLHYQASAEEFGICKAQEMRIPGTYKVVETYFLAE
ncbi:hypothetical protein QUF76_15010 [Desulfobacterales bacterium HSG16]|nr:hypothetical protein [Desulfobacterales bacterium HSG16]